MDSGRPRADDGPAVESGCRLAQAPSFPAIAAVRGSRWVAYYDGPHTVIAAMPDGPNLELEHPVGAGAPQTFGPAILATPEGALLVTVEPRPSGFIVQARRLAADLASASPVQVVASGVDGRYTPGLVARGGGALVAFIESSSGHGRAAIQNIDPTGAPTGPPAILSEEPTQAGGISLTRGADGLAVAWIDPRLGFSPLYVALGADSGRIDSPAIALTTGSIARTPLVAGARGSGSGVLVAWTHMGPLGQDYLSMALWQPGAPPPRARPLSRVDAYGTFRAAVLARPGGYVALWDEPIEEGRWPPTSVKMQMLDVSGEPVGTAETLGEGSGVSAVLDDRTAFAAFRRSRAVCVAWAPLR